MKLNCPVLAVLFVLAIGGLVGVATTTNNPTVAKFGQDHLK